MEPSEFKAMMLATRQAWQSIGQISYGPTEQEIGSVAFRRSLYAVVDIKAGEQLTSSNVKSIRPGLGLAPKHWDKVLTQYAKADITCGTALSWDLLTGSN